MTIRKTESANNRVMTKKTKILIAVLLSLGLLIGALGWSYAVIMILPGGLGWTADKDVPFIEEMHPVRLVDPNAVPKDEDGDVFMSWAMEELKARLKLGACLWVVATGLLAVWAQWPRTEKNPITKPCT